MVCTDCEWSASTEESSREEVNRKAIQHHVETTHRVVSMRHRNAQEPTLLEDGSN
jgi:predicted small metal-binding protein